MKPTRHETQLEAVPEARRDEAIEFIEERLREDASETEAVAEALRRFGATVDEEVPDAVESPDVSLARPHGPEGEAHGGRGGRDPLRFVEDSTPAGTNAYSSTRDPPSRKAPKKAP
jgi:hypothetical protein